MQRKVERAMRTQKRRIITDEATGDKEKLQTDQIRYVRLNDEYARFSKAAGMRTQMERAEVGGFGPKQATEATAEHKNHLQNPHELATLKAVSGARITDIYGKPAQRHAEKYYDLVRSMKTDVSHIAKSTGYSEEDIRKIKDFLFNEKHDLGDGRIDRFDPDFAIAQSWQRLVDGKPLRHDLTLINHEAMERELMRGGMSQHDAHIQTSSRYNYSEEVREFYASLKEHKNKRHNR